MGLRLSHGDFEASYSGFMAMRVAVVNALGVPTDIHNLYSGRNDWQKLIEHPIFPLIDHSDCDGHLSVEEIAKILPELAKASSKIADPSMKERVDEFAKSIACAHRCGEPVLFK